MISVNEADVIIREHIACLGGLTVCLKDCYGHVLDEDIVADRDFPSCDKSLMDGVAVAFKAIEEGKKAFVIEGVQAA
jgi:molybdopterin molybdotransferase